VAAILEAGARVLSQDPQASMAAIAGAAGLSRQTTYAHFASRETLLEALQERAMHEVEAALDAADLEHGPPAQALERLLHAGWQVGERYPVLFHLPTASREQDIQRHQFLVDRLERLVQRGQASGDFDARLPPAWYLTAIFALGNAANEQVQAGRLTARQASDALHLSILRLFGIPPASRET
jgi:AcrR family transcriptional regulator